MNKRTQRIIVIIVAAALLLTVLVPILGGIAAATVTQDDINGIKGELADIAAQKAQVQKELNAIRGDLSRAKEQVELIQGQIVMTEQEISQGQRLLEEYDRQIAQKETEIVSLEAQEAQQYEKFYAQVRWMEETGAVSYLSIFFQASSFSEMLDYATLIGDIMEYNNRIITDLETTQQELGEVRTQLQTSRDEQVEVQKTLEAQRAELVERKAEAQKLYDEVDRAENAVAAKAAQLLRDEAAMERELKEAERKYAEQIANMGNINTGEWYWPLPGVYYISSIFGGRYHPITGRWESHTGTDIPAAGGTPIHAAQGGVVTVSKYNASYGNYCIISHGNGRVTLYAHMRKLPLVKVGQTVEKGQVIGYVGTTGSSTGNHLHFELRVNGTRDNVLKFYPHLPYTGPYVSQIKKQLGLA